MAGGQGGQGGGQGQMPQINPQLMQSLQGLLSQYQGGQGGFQGPSQGQGGFLSQGGQPPMQGGVQGQGGFLRGGHPPMQTGPAMMPSSQQGTFTGQLMDGRLLDDGSVVGRNDPRFYSPASQQPSPAPQVLNTKPLLQTSNAPSAPQTFNTKPFNQGPAPVQNTGGPDVTGTLAGGGMGFDGSGSDAGVAGQPVTQVQSPYQPNQGLMQGANPPTATGMNPIMGGSMRTTNSPTGIMSGAQPFQRGAKPPMMSDFRPQQGLQIQGNPTSQPFMPRRPR